MAKPATQVPVSAHPLFPVIVALWFAALLGIGMMVLPQALFDRIGVATGLGEIGFTFRLGFGLTAGLIGAVLGYTLARKLATGPTPAKPRSRAAAARPGKNETRKPISAMEELGSDGLDEPVDKDPVRPASEPINGRRRALTVIDESSPNDFIMQVPLPGGEGTLDLIGADEPINDDSALELGAFNYEEQDAVPDYPHPTGSDTAGSPLFGADPFGHDSDHAPQVAPAAAAPTAMDGIFRAPPPAHSVEPAFQPAAPFTNPAQTPPPFAAPVAADVAPGPVPGHAPQPVAAPFAPPVSDPVPPSIRGAAFSMPVPASADPAPQPAFAPPPMPMAQQTPPAVEQPHDLAALDTVALVERFARALRRAGSAAMTASTDEAAGTAPVPLAEPLAAPLAAPFAAPPPPMATPAYPTPPHPAATAIMPAAPSLPAALTPLSFDEAEDSDDHEAVFTMPFAAMARPFEQASPAPAQQAFTMPAPAPEPMAEPDSEGEPENDDSFGSLLAMKAGFGPGREFVRIEDEAGDDGPIEPVVVFPGTAQQGQAAPAPDGPSRDPAQNAPFARPPFAPPVAAPNAQPVDRNATEAALRDALARLQQMSGAA